MSEKAIGIEMLRDDIKSMIYKARGHKQRILNALKDNDIYSHIEQIFNEQGYVYNLDREKKMFTISASYDVSIIGMIGNGSIKLGPSIRYDNIECSFEDVRIGMVDFPITDLDTFIPLINKMVCEGKVLT